MLALRVQVDSGAAFKNAAAEQLRWILRQLPGHRMRSAGGGGGSAALPERYLLQDVGKTVCLRRRRPEVTQLEVRFPLLRWCERLRLGTVGL